MNRPQIHDTAEVSPQAIIGDGTRIWHQAQVREGAKIGKNCILGKGVYVDFDVIVGDNVKIQNGSSVFHGAVLHDGVFLGPGVILTNDKFPRAINLDGSLKTDDEWTQGKIVVGHGASLGARVVVLPGVVIGKFSMVGAGAVVTRDVPDHGLVMGNPATLQGYVCNCGHPLKEGDAVEGEMTAWCDQCEQSVMIQAEQWQ